MSVPVQTGQQMWVGVDGGSWGLAGAQDLKLAVDYSRIDAVASGQSTVTNYLNAGVTIFNIFSGPFSPSGVSGLGNPTTFANNRLASYKALGLTPTTAPVWEILNEPAGPWFWGTNAASPANRDAYALLLKACWTAAHNEYGAGAPLILASYDGGAQASSWGQGWVNSTAVSNVLQYVDGITTHPYGGSGGQYGGAGGNRDFITAAHQATGKPVYCTETGWPTASGFGSTGDSQQWTEAQQASNISNFVTWARGTGYVGGVIIYNFRDNEGTDHQYGIENTGPAGAAPYTKKASFAALTAVSRGSGAPPPVVSQANHFGVARSTAADWNATSVPTSEQKPAWAIYKAALATSGSPNFTGTGTTTSISYIDSPHGSAVPSGTVTDSRSGPADDHPTGSVGVTGHVVESWGPTGQSFDFPSGEATVTGSVVESNTRGATITFAPEPSPAEIDTPHFSFPFRFAGDPVAAVAQQNTLEHVAACVANIAVCPQGFRTDLPDFGIPDPTFRALPVDTSDIRDAIAKWEPRARLVTIGASGDQNQTLTVDVLVAADNSQPEVFGQVTIDLPYPSTSLYPSETLVP